MSSACTVCAVDGTTTAGDPDGTTTVDPWGAGVAGDWMMTEPGWTTTGDGGAASVPGGEVPMLTFTSSARAELVRRRAGAKPMIAAAQIARALIASSDPSADRALQYPSRGSALTGHSRGPPSPRSRRARHGPRCTLMVRQDQCQGSRARVVPRISPRGEPQGLPRGRQPDAVTTA